MADTHDTRYQLRATLAAALIQGKIVDLSTMHLANESTAQNAPAMHSLKIAVDALMNAVVYK